jgi:hypothetical protein
MGWNSCLLALLLILKPILHFDHDIAEKLLPIERLEIKMRGHDDTIFLMRTQNYPVTRQQTMSTAKRERTLLRLA